MKRFTSIPRVAAVLCISAPATNGSHFMLPFLNWELWSRDVKDRLTDNVQYAGLRGRYINIQFSSPANGGDVTSPRRKVRPEQNRKERDQKYDSHLFGDIGNIGNMGWLLRKRNGDSTQASSPSGALSPHPRPQVPATVVCRSTVVYIYCNGRSGRAC